MSHVHPKPPCVPGPQTSHFEWRQGSACTTNSQQISCPYCDHHAYQTAFRTPTIIFDPGARLAAYILPKSEAGSRGRIAAVASLARDRPPGRTSRSRQKRWILEAPWASSCKIDEKNGEGKPNTTRPRIPTSASNRTNSRLTIGFLHFLLLVPPGNRLPSNVQQVGLVHFPDFFFS